MAPPLLVFASAGCGRVSLLSDAMQRNTLMKSRRRKRPTLPPSCPSCRPYGGLWRRGNKGGLERCSCARGRMLAAGLKKAKPVPKKPAPLDWGKRAAGDKS